MKRLKSTLASILLAAAGAAAIGLGTVMGVAALVIGLVIAAAARLAVNAQRPGPAAPPRAEQTGIVDGELVRAG